MKTITIIMPYTGNNLSVNSYRYSGKKGQSYLVKSSVKGWMVELAKKAKESRSNDLVPPLVVTVSGRFRNSASEPDLDNLSKVICDSLKAGLEIDDKYFRYRAGTVTYGYTSPELVIEISKEV